MKGAAAVSDTGGRRDGGSGGERGAGKGPGRAPGKFAETAAVRVRSCGAGSATGAVPLSTPLGANKRWKDFVDNQKIKEKIQTKASDALTWETSERCHSLCSVRGILRTTAPRHPGPVAGAHHALPVLRP